MWTLGNSKGALMVIRKRMKYFLWAGVVALCAIGYVVFPFVRASYLAYKFERHVRVRLDIQDCIKPYPGTNRVECCQCIFAFEGVLNPRSINFKGDSLSYRYDDAQKTYTVSGEGLITNGNNSVELRSGHLHINGQAIPVKSTPLQVAITEDGELINQRTEFRW
jgi:hypothetical protein